jgi:hypothetical protein
VPNTSSRPPLLTVVPLAVALDAVASGGGLIVSSGGTDSGITISAGGSATIGSETISAGGTDDGAQVSGGTQFDFGTAPSTLLIPMRFGRNTRWRCERSQVGPGPAAPASPMRFSGEGATSQPDEVRAHQRAAARPPGLLPRAPNVLITR